MRITVVPGGRNDLPRGDGADRRRDRRSLSEGHIRTFRGAKADVEVAFAQFDGAVLAALWEAESALVVSARDLDQRELLAASRDQAGLATDAETLLKAGSTNYLTALDANLALITADQSLAMLDGKIVDDQITPFLALGGGGNRRGCCRISRS
jgi:outer membrane protein, multidrug efflux system